MRTLWISRVFWKLYQASSPEPTATSIVHLPKANARNDRKLGDRHTHSPFPNQSLVRIEFVVLLFIENGNHFQFPLPFTPPTP